MDPAQKQKKHTPVDKSGLERIFSYVQGLSTGDLIKVFVISGFMMGFFDIYLRKIQMRSDFNLTDVLLVFAIFFIWGGVGIVTMIRREFYLVAIKIQGIVAQILGGGFTILSWGLALLLLLKH